MNSWLYTIVVALCLAFLALSLTYAIIEWVESEMRIRRAIRRARKFAENCEKHSKPKDDYFHKPFVGKRMEYRPEIIFETTEPLKPVKPRKTSKRKRKKRRSRG